MDWIYADLPFEGNIREETLGFLADRSVPTCRPDEPVAAALARAAGRGPCAVVNGSKVLLGLLPTDASGTGPVIDAMDEGPSTYRPHVPAAEVLPQAERRHRDPVIVTTHEGRLVGFVGLPVLRAVASKEE